MPPIVGMRGTEQLGPEQRKIDMSKQIKMLVPDETPFTTFLQQLSKTRTGYPEFRALEDDVLPRFDSTTTVGTGTTVTVATATKFAVNDIIIVTRTNEQMIVATVPTSGNDITVTRGTPAVALISGDELLIAGSAQPEGDRSRIPVSANPVPVLNYTQILRRSWELTGTALASDNETTPHDWDYQAAKIGIEHKRDIERTLLFGVQDKKTAGTGQILRTTGGLFHWVKTNQVLAGGGFSEDELNLFARQLFRYGAKRKVLMGSPLATGVLNTFPMSKVRIAQSEKRYGINVTTFVSPFGELGLVTNWEFEGTKYGGVLVGYDPANIRYRFLSNSKQQRDSHVNTEIQPPDQDSRRDEWLTECGLEVNLEKTHGIVTGITGAA